MQCLFAEQPIDETLGFDSVIGSIKTRFKRQHDFFVVVADTLQRCKLPLAHILTHHGLRYLRIDGTYYAYLLVPSDGYKSEVPAGWLSLLVNAGDGIDLDVFLTRQPKDRMIRKLGQQLRINRSKIKETSDTNTDFDDLDSAIRSGYFLKDGLSNHEDFYYLNLISLLQYRLLKLL